jgi:hypothetical protein
MGHTGRRKGDPSSTRADDRGIDLRTRRYNPDITELSKTIDTLKGLQTAITRLLRWHTKETEKMFWIWNHVPAGKLAESVELLEGLKLKKYKEHDQ